MTYFGGGHAGDQEDMSGLGLFTHLCKRYEFLCVFSDLAGGGSMGKGVRGIG